MLEQFLVTITGPYRPGIMNQLAALTHQHQGKWLSNKMANLEGQFAAIIKVELPQASTSALQAALAALPELQLTVHEHSPIPTQTTQSIELKIDARDQPGLINEITKVISDQDISVDHMASRRLSVPGTGDTVFTAEFSLTTPAELSPATLVAELEALYPHLIAVAQPTPTQR
jgi:glycine cleavage system regulatory protein